MHNFNRDLWEIESFRVDKHVPLWPCRFCWNTPFRLEKKLEIIFNESAEDPYDINHSFIGILSCKACLNKISISGEATLELDHVFIKGKYQEGGGLFERFYPKYFFPNLRLFFLQEYFPNVITVVLDRAFALFFSDIHASANMVRVAVEKLLDLDKFGKIPRRDKQKRFIYLDTRIEHIKDPEVKKLLQAIKWIGNYGAHLDEKRLTRETLLDAFEIMHYILENTFSTASKEVKKKANKINKKHPRKSKL